MKNGTCVLVAALLVMAVGALNAWADPLANGTFDAGIEGWTVEPVELPVALWYDGGAVLINPTDHPMEDYLPLAAGCFLFIEPDFAPPEEPVMYSWLHQTFTLPEQADKLTFDVTMEVYTYMGIGETDVFKGMLWYGPALETPLQIAQLDSSQVLMHDGLTGEYLTEESYVDATI